MATAASGATPVTAQSGGRRHRRGHKSRRHSRKAHRKTHRRQQRK